MNFLLDLVSDDGVPDFGVTIIDNIQIIFEEYGAELWTMFALGILVGIGLTNLYRFIKSFFTKNDKDNKEGE